jgi:hypothetical protein
MAPWHGKHFSRHRHHQSRHQRHGLHCDGRPFIDPTEIAACDSTGRHLPLLCVSNLANGYNEILRERDLTMKISAKSFLRPSPETGPALLPWYTASGLDLPLAVRSISASGRAISRPTSCAGRSRKAYPQPL